MTAFANSHLKVLRQCNAAIISAVRIYGNLLSQYVRRLFLFLCIERSITQIFFCFFHTLMSVSSLWCHHTPGEFSRPAAAVGRGLPYISYMLAAVVEHCLSGASYAEQSQISACMKLGNGAYIHRKMQQTFITTATLYFLASPSSVPPARCIFQLCTHNFSPYAAAGSLYSP